MVQCCSLEQFHQKFRSLEIRECGGEAFPEKDRQGDWDAGWGGFGEGNVVQIQQDKCKEERW